MTVNPESSKSSKILPNTVDRFLSALGVILVGLGIWLVYQGLTASAETELFGFMVKSLYVGVVCLILGAVLVGILGEKAVKELLDSPSRQA